MRSPSSRFRSQAFALALGSLVAACGSGSSGGNGGNTSWSGTLVSGTTFGRRGTFQFTGSIQGEAISGTLDLAMGSSPEVSHPVTGTVRHEFSPPSNSYDVVELQDAGGSVSFSSTTHDGYANDSEMIGTYTDGDDSGAWHTVVGGVAEAPVEKAFALPAGMTVGDLCFAEGELYAVATPSGGTSALYSVNRDTGEFLLVAGSPAGPTGIAHDGTQYWLNQQSTLQNYDASWQGMGAEWTVSTLGPASSQFAVYGGKAWFLPRLGGNVTTVDLTTGAGSDSGISVERPGGIDFVGDRLWTSYFPPGAVWGSLREYELGGAEHIRFYTPENGGGPVAADGDSLWVVSVKGLYEVRVR